VNAKGVKKRVVSEDELLVRRVQKGEWDAFEILVLKYQERIFRVVRRFLGDGEQVEDLAQEVFIRAYRSVGSFEGKSSFYTWLYKIALNTCRNHYRSIGRRPEGATVDGEAIFEKLAGREGGPEKDAFRAEFWDVVSRSMEELPREQREVIVLCDLEGLSYEEIAGIVDSPVGTVRSRVFRGRRALQKLLKPYLRGTL
jgi:RNA polymerase sigma-70 factor (ECF subfamily)